uniref:Secreted protein n=1 Tax=Lotus japonicus TaxID=34305 RepID=I3S3C4_LOTJA|nr:unknown [Lotus japonicus]
MRSVPVRQLLIFLVVLSIRVGADNRTNQEDGADPILGDLVVNLGGKILPETGHDLLLEWRERVHHRFHWHNIFPHFLLLRSSSIAIQQQQQ